MLPAYFTRLFAAACFLFVTMHCAVGGAFSSQGRGTHPKPLEFSDVLKSREISLPSTALSPDGEFVAYVTKPIDRVVAETGQDLFSLAYTETGALSAARFTTLLITNTRTGETTSIGDDSHAVWAPSWSSDGESLAFYSDRDGSSKVWIWNRQTRESRPVSQVLVRTGWIGFGEPPQWAEDDRSLIVKTMPEGMSTKFAREYYSGAPSAAQKGSDIVEGSTARLFRNDSGEAKTETNNGTDASRQCRLERPSPVLTADVAKIEVGSGAVEYLQRGVDLRAAYSVSPSGKHVAILNLEGDFPGSGDDCWSIRVMDANTGHEGQVVAGIVGSTDPPAFRWRGDSRAFAYFEGPRPRADGKPRPGVVNVLTLGGSPREVMAPDSVQFEEATFRWLPGNRGLAMTGNGKLWVAGRDLRAQILYESQTHDIVGIISGPHSDSAWTSRDQVYVETAQKDTSVRGIARVREGKIDVVRHGGRGFGSTLVARNGSRVVLKFEDAAQPPEIWTAQRDFTDARPLTRVNEHLRAYTFGSTQTVSYDSARDAGLRGLLLLPSNYVAGKRYPLLVWIYPGDTPWIHASRFGGPFGSTYGLQFNLQLYATRGYAVLFPESPQRVGTPMRDMADGIHAAIDRVVDLGIADPDRIGVFGQSYGGYSTLAMLTQSERFKAGVASAPLAHLIGWDSEYAAYGQGKLGVTLWEDRDRYIENSPIFYFDRIRTPLLIVVGDQDLTEMVSSADAAFDALARRLDRTVEYRRYAGESHVLLSPKNMEDQFLATLRWFDRYVRGATEN